MILFRVVTIALLVNLILMFVLLKILGNWMFHQEFLEILVPLLVLMQMILFRVLMMTVMTLLLFHLLPLLHLLPMIIFGVLKIALLVNLMVIFVLLKILGNWMFHQEFLEMLVMFYLLLLMILFVSFDFVESLFSH